MIFPIPSDLLNRVVGYLGTRPYQEVYQLIQDIQETAKPKEDPKEESNG